MQVPAPRKKVEVVEEGEHEHKCVNPTEHGIVGFYL
jgi:hypothetical protein